MSTPLHNIKDDRQLDYVIEAIDEISRDLFLCRYKLAYVYKDAEDAYDAITHLRALVQNFVRTGLGIVDGSEGEDDE